MTAHIPAKFLMASAVVFSVAGIALLVFPLGWLLRFHWPAAAALGWDAALSLAFFVQHSGMVRPRVRAALGIPEHLESVVYAAASGVTLILAMVLWQSTGPWFSIEGPARVAMRLAAVLALGVFAWGLVALRHFDPCGLEPVRAHLRGAVFRPMPFVARGPYLWVRHPLYSAVLVLIWTYPDVSLDRLLFDLLWTVWICAAAGWEERDLVREFGAPYESYRRKVPMLVPWRGRVVLDAAAGRA